MVNIKIVRFVLFLSLLFHSCGPGFVNYDENLGDGYTYDGRKSLIFSEDGFEEGIYPKVINYNFDNNFIIIIQKPFREDFKFFLASDIAANFIILLYYDNKHMIPTEIKFKNSFWWQDTILRKKMATYVNKENNNNIEKIDEIVDSVLTNNEYFKNIFARELNYWIIVKKNREILGPYSFDEYKAQRKELNMPESLHFKF